MKLMNPSKQKAQSGMTLIEVTVVLVVLLTLIAVLYFSASAYVKSSNRSACLTNQARLQKAMRGYQLVHQLTESSTFDWVDLDAGGYIEGSADIKCPANAVNYLTSGSSVVPAIGTRDAPCVDPNYAIDHTASSLALY